MYFRSEYARNEYLKDVKRNNFNIITQYYSEGIDRYHFVLKISRIDFVDFNSVNKYVIYLLELANKLEADYDGWETSVEK